MVLSVIDQVRSDCKDVRAYSMFTLNHVHEFQYILYYESLSIILISVGKQEPYSDLYSSLKQCFIFSGKAAQKAA